MDWRKEYSQEFKNILAPSFVKQIQHNILRKVNNSVGQNAIVCRQTVSKIFSSYLSINNSLAIVNLISKTLLLESIVVYEFIKKHVVALDNVVFK